MQFDSNYQIKNKNVYYYNKKIDGADASTFHAISKNHAVDKKRIYFQGVKVKGIVNSNIQTNLDANDYWLKDEQGFYFRGYKLYDKVNLKPQPMQQLLKRSAIKLDNSGRSLSIKAIRKVEKSMGFSLPDEYREFLLTYNGGVPVVPDELEASQIEAMRFYRIDQTQECMSLVENYEHYKEKLPHGILPIAEDGGGNPYLLVCVGPSSGTVLFAMNKFFGEPGDDDRSPDDITIYADQFSDLFEDEEFAEEQLSSEWMIIQQPQFHIKVPGDWKIEKDKRHLLNAFLPQISGEWKSRAELKIIRAKLDQNIQVKDYFQNTLQAYKKIWKVLAKKNIRIEGFPGVEAVIMQTSGMYKSWLLKYFIAVNEDLFIITFSAIKGYESEYESIFREMMKSFSLNL